MSTGWEVGHLLTAEEVADVLRATVKTVGRLRREGQLRGVRVGRAYRFHPDDVSDYLRRARPWAAAG